MKISNFETSHNKKYGQPRVSAGKHGLEAKIMGNRLKGWVRTFYVFKGPKELRKIKISKNKFFMKSPNELTKIELKKK